MKSPVFALSLVLILFVGALPAAAQPVAPAGDMGPMPPVIGPGGPLSSFGSGSLSLNPVQDRPAADAQTLYLARLEPGTIDPASAVDTTSHFVVDQLFAGLTRIDDATGEALPDLASGWEVAPDGQVITFTLRSGLTWSDGQPLTAADVRYGVLRSLAPATESGYAYVLKVIRNAAQYHAGDITDPNQVGVSALDATHVRFDLAYPQAFFPSVAALWVARPMPSWAISSWGEAWTEPAHIVTSGPYRLGEWQAGDHMMLDRNPDFGGAAVAQIEHVRIVFADEATAWRQYQGGRADTAAVPLSEKSVGGDPIFGTQTRLAPVACTYFYGFNVARPPFDNPLVRKAFIAATNRQGLIDTVTGGIQRPALTFTPPGIFGSVDGAAEGVGIPYNPVQARAWLAQAGYPDGQGLPPVTLTFNTSIGHRAIAQYVRQSWSSNLGVTVALQDVGWQEFLRRVDAGDFQVWRNGWCVDYNDAYNFLHDGMVAQERGFGDWTNAAYQGLLNQAVVTADAAARKALYKQAEEILVETDAVMLPLYHYTSVVAQRPYLARTYALGGDGSLTAWRLDFADDAAVTPAATAVFTPTQDYVTYQLPAGTFTEAVTVTHTVLRPGDLPAPGQLVGLGRGFEVTATNSAGAALKPTRAYSLTVRYSDRERGVASEETLALYYRENDAWVREPTSVVDAVANTVTASPSHFSLWAVLGEPKRVYLPLVLRN